MKSREFADYAVHRRPLISRAVKWMVDSRRLGLVGFLFEPALLVNIKSTFELCVNMNTFLIRIYGFIKNKDNFGILFRKIPYF